MSFAIRLHCHTWAIPTKSEFIELFHCFFLSFSLKESFLIMYIFDYAIITEIFNAHLPLADCSSS
jgi:hypothetical protein